MCAICCIIASMLSKNTHTSTTAHLHFAANACIMLSIPSTNPEHTMRKRFTAQNYYLTLSGFYATMEAYVEDFVFAGCYNVQSIDDVARYVLHCAAQCKMDLTHRQFCAAMLRFKDEVLRVN